ncbi:NAD(P)-dependent oxidoreductase [Alkalibacillus haloalkaliphilus]|uniref:NAD(P)-dependent oxidoreductase n=1 Tax=Alkalibacillus haloalkaliphilus TaxID=94136 RepID=UPI0029369439|nr:NAD(P)-dependent oxidoreductase [Alkalibacillus haloalkaliphilus]MDV2582159.1 NAD(P)-dependent oxidoreductase [Alkalibacillus haloalkaliphilus]
MNLLITGAFKHTDDQIGKLKELGFKIIYVQEEREELDIEVGDIDAVVCNNLFLYNDIRKFKNLKFIQVTSAGLDRVPIDYINKHGIELYNAKDVYSIPMAEWVVLKVLEIYKKSKQLYQNQINKTWEKQRDIQELNGKTAVIIGYGNVGFEITKRLKAFGVNLIGVARSTQKPSEVDEYYNIEHIDKAIIKSDIIISTLPLTDETRDLINDEKISLMKDKSILINVSRGGVIDEKALIDSLNKNKFLGVALDVFNSEPLPTESPLWSFDEVIISPHNSFISDQTNERLYGQLINNLSANLVELKDS